MAYSTTDCSGDNEQWPENTPNIDNSSSNNSGYDPNYYHNTYSALRTRKNLTLPNIEGWGNNNNALNIKKDPPRSIHTRKIVKVGEDNTLNELIDGSGDRASQSINMYARGVNPMVSMQYGNYNAQQSRTQPSLVHKIMDKGSFRPPIIPLEDRLPLSRQNRLTTSNVVNPMIDDYTKVSRGTFDANMARSIKTLTNIKDVESRVRNIVYHGVEPVSQGRQSTKEIIVRPVHSGVSVSSDRIMDDSTRTRFDLKGVYTTPLNLTSVTTLPGSSNSLMDERANWGEIVNSKKLLEHAIETNRGNVGIAVCDNDQKRPEPVLRYKSRPTQSLDGTQSKPIICSDNRIPNLKPKSIYPFV